MIRLQLLIFVSDKLAFLIRHEHGPQIDPNNLSIIFGDDTGGTEGLASFRYMLALLHISPGDEGMQPVFSKTAAWGDDLMYEMRKEVNSMTQKILGREIKVLRLVDNLKPDPGCQPS